ncbi:MAG: phosphotransferase enzyme family protein [Candidatus Odinarchaeota archaeon]
MTSENQQQQDSNLLEEICRLYGISVSDLQLIVAIAKNFVYEFQKDGKKYILRGGTRHSADLVRAEIDWILYLHSSGVKVSVPVQSKNKKYLELIKKGGQVFNAVVFEKAPGKAVDARNPKEWNEGLWETMGKVMGKIHAASVRYNLEKPAFRRKAYHEDEYARTDNLDPVKDAIVIKKFKELKEKLGKLPKEQDSYGLIHYDFHTDNFNVDRGKITVFDWNDSHYCFFIYDLAASFHEAIWDNPVEKRQGFADRFIPHFWKGYSEEFQLDRKWLDHLADFFKWREFTIYAAMVEDYNDVKTPEGWKKGLPTIIAEFRDWIVNDTQIVDIPRDLTKWFPN